MSWRDDLLPGSFRGIAFVMRSAGGEFGRRVSLHEFPLRDKPYAEDLGKKARKLSIEAILIGDDYHLTRDRLIDAVEQPGVGELVHPRLGIMQVTVVNFRVRETTRQAGMATVSMEVVETGELVFPNTTIDTVTLVNTVATNAELAALDSFENNFSVEQQPGWVSTYSIEKLTGLVDSIRAINGQVNMALEPLSATAQQLDNLGTELATLILTPRSLGSAVISVISAVFSVDTDARSARESYKNLSTFGSGDVEVPLSTPSRKAQARNQSAINVLVQQGAAISSARASSNIDFDSYDEAAQVRTEIIEQLDSVSQSVSFSLFVALADLRTATVNDATTRGGDLGRIVNHTPKATLPAALIAYQLYGDASKDADLIRRNGIADPLFVTGGEALEVLSA